MHERERTLSETGLAGRAVLAGADFASVPSSLSRPGIPPRTSGESGSTGGGASRHHRTSSDSVNVGGLGIGIAPPGVRRQSSLSQRRTPSRDAERASGSITESKNDFDSKLRDLTDAFQSSMGRVERRPSTVVEASESSSSSPARERERLSTLGPSPFPPSPAPYNPGPGAAHLRTPSFSAATGAHAPRSTTARRLTTASSNSSSSHVPTLPDAPGLGSGSGGVPSIWDNRGMRPRTDSAGSAASGSGASGVGLGERERARLFYGQGHSARGSVVSMGGASGSAGSEEVMGRMDMDR